MLLLFVAPLVTRTHNLKFEDGGCLPSEQPPLVTSLLSWISFLMLKFNWYSSVPFTLYVYLLPCPFMVILIFFLNFSISRTSVEPCTKLIEVHSVPPLRKWRLLGNTLVPHWMYKSLQGNCSLPTLLPSSLYLVLLRMVACFISSTQAVLGPSIQISKEQKNHSYILFPIRRVLWHLSYQNLYLLYCSKHLSLLSPSSPSRIPALSLNSAAPITLL